MKSFKNVFGRNSHRLTPKKALRRIQWSRRGTGLEVKYIL